MNYYGSPRPTLDQLENDWCKGDLTILASEDEGQVMAMPLAEAEKSEKYIGLIKTINTYQDAQNLYEIYCNDSEAPRLTPFLFDLKESLESLDQRVQQEYRSLGRWDSNRWEGEPPDPITSPDWFNDLNADFECSVESLWEEVKNLKFELNFDPCYNADSIPRYLGSPQIWTDQWIPMEIASKIGVPDLGMGLDYLPAEFSYLSIYEFEKIFGDFNFEVIFDVDRIQSVAWKWV
jgi:hypothetical protein